MTPEIPTWSEIAKAGDAFDLEPFKAMAEEAGQNPVDAEQAKTGSKVRVHEGYQSGAKSSFDPDKFVPVKNGEDGKMAPGTGFYFTNLGADGLSDYYHDHSRLYTNSDGSELDRSGVAFTLDPKTHISIKNSKDYGDFLRKYHRFFDYSKGKGKPIWGVLPDWEAAARDGIGSVQFPYASLNTTEGRSLYSEYWTGPNGERGQPQYIYPHPNEGFILRPEAVVTQRPYDYFKEKVPNAKDPSTEDRHLAGLTPEGKAFMEDVYKKMYFSPSELKYWHAFARKHPEMTREQLRREYGGLWKSVKSVESGSSTMTGYPEIPTWAQIASAQTRLDATLNDINPLLPPENAWDYGQEAATRAAKLRSDAQALGNTQMDTQKNLYDRAKSAQTAHDLVPGLVARHAPAITPEAKVETPAAGTLSNLLQTHIDAHNKFDPDIWESASRNKQLLNNAVKHRDAFQTNNIDGKEYSPTDMAKVRGSLDRLNRLVALKVDDYTDDMNAIRDVSEDADIFDAQRRMDTSTGQQE